MHRRSLLIALACGLRGASARAAGAGVAAPAALQFPRDFGAHPQTRIEWWYATGTLTARTPTAEAPATDARRWGFQVTFFRSATGLTGEHASRFAATQVMFAHAAVSDLQAGRLRHDQRIARSGFGIAGAELADTRVNIRDWRFEREGTGGAAGAQGAAAEGASRYHARVASDAAGFRLDLQLAATQPVLLQGDAGLSRKGPSPEQASRYYSEPQLAVGGTLALDGKPVAVQGRAWLDHEWSDSLLAPGAIGWDWIGMNLDDGSALTAFRLRRADGSALWAGGSFRGKGEATRDFGPDEVRFAPGRTWESPATRSRYPVEWSVETPAGRFQVKAMLDPQELDGLAGNGAVYWEGLSELFDAAGQRIGRGYLEMTGYASPLKM